MTAIAPKMLELLGRPASEAECRWLTALAAEEWLGEAALTSLSREPSELKAWLAHAVATGLVVESSRARPASLLRERVAYGLLPDARQVILRESHAQGTLAAMVSECSRVLGERSRTSLALLLQRGDLAGAERWLQSVPQQPQLGVRRTASEELEGALRASICAPFDEAWFERTYGDRALAVAVRVLGHALPCLHPCGDLYSWTLARALLPDLDFSFERASVLCQHALLRGDLLAVETHVLALPVGTRLGYQSALSYLRGDATAALRALEQSRAFGGESRTGRGSAHAAIAACGAVAPLLALLLCSTGNEADRALARQCLSAQRAFHAGNAAGRALRTLLRYATEPDAQHSRIDSYQLPASTPAWEFLILGLTVHLYQEQRPTRAAWAKLLVQKGLAWLSSGYRWFARQALFLAHALDGAYFAEELESAAPRALVESLARAPGELSLSTLLTPKPDWEKALDALSEASELAQREAETAQRLAWHVDMADGSLSRPALQEFRAESGWTAGRRMTLAEAYERIASLPPEDVKVLRSTREYRGREREFLPEVWEALVGHPRVLNGVRNQFVEVVSAECRVVTSESDDSIEIRVNPPHLPLGVSARIDGETRISVYRVTHAMHKVISALPRTLRIPKNHERQALAVLGKLTQSIEVQSPLLGTERTVAADATPCLRISPHAGAWLVQAGVRPFGARGVFFVAGTGRATLATSVHGEKLRCERDFEREIVLLSELVCDCPTLLEAAFDPELRAPFEPAQSWVFGHEVLLGFLSELGRARTPHVFEWPETPALHIRGHVSSRSLRARLRRVKGWYLATGQVRIDDITELTLSELTALPSLAGGRFVQLPNGDFLEIEARVRRVMAALARAEPVRGASGLRLHESALHALRLLAEEDNGVTWDEPARLELERLRRTEGLDFELPVDLRAELRPYQMDGFRFLRRLSELGFGACLADDMGLGKTVQILALLLDRKTSGPALVVAPTSVCSNWICEIARFAPSLRAAEYTGKDRGQLLEALRTGPTSAAVLVCSYTLLEQDREALSAIDWASVVLDEAQFIKNPSTRRAEAAHRLNARCRIAATGTPVENHVGDLWSIFHFLNPALLGPLRAFDRHFVKPVERDGDSARRAELRRHIEPFILRRSKSQVLPELPPVTTIQHEVRLSEAESLRYALLRRQIHEKLRTVHGKRQHKLQILAEITRLRRFCCHPRLVFPDADYASSKIETFLELVEELCQSGHRALVFSQFVDFLSLVRDRLDEQRIAYEYLDGSTPKRERQIRTNAFQTGAMPLFLISLKAGGFGLNLTAADYVIHLDPWWNPAVEAQATDRAHRIGQERPVTVYRLVTRHTIEESIVELHREKRRLADALLASDEGTDNLRADELLALIGEDAEPETGASRDALVEGSRLA